MIVWEWRRLLRQKLRSFTPNKSINYQQISRRRIIVSFVLFFVGWKAFGYTLNDMFLWTVDEQTMQGRFLTPQEGKERRETLERQRDPKLRITVPPIVSKYDLDD